LGSALPTAPAKSYPPASTGFAALDALLGGGIPRGQITELVGQASSGRTSVAFAILAESTARGEVVAYIDVCDSLDPRSAQKAGIALERLLWVRGGKQVSGGRCQVAGKDGKQLAGVECEVPGTQTPDTRHLKPDTSSSPSWQAVNLVASAGGFGVIVLDLGGVAKRRLREWQSRQWLRLRRAIEHSPTALVLLASDHLASTVSALVLELSRERTRWEGAPGVSFLLEGVATQVRIGQKRKGVKTGTRDCRLEIGP
jgi:hypothetical protein